MQKNEVVRGCTMKKKTGSVIRAVGMFLCPVAMYYLMEAFHMNAFVMTKMNKKESSDSQETELSFCYRNGITRIRIIR